jgi:hypothetical protein
VSAVVAVHITKVYSAAVQKKRVRPGPTLAWPGWKQPDISVKVDTARLEAGQFKKCCMECVLLYYTIKRVDEVVRYPHLVTQDQFTQVSKKVSDIPEENFTVNIELFQHFSQVSN